ncbi:hypothetical protein [Mastigocladopsis repens]|uniref:hypothetical protein n=1 Tax=Mastigocladopsis repens TaxID=221287 RepID=UPI00030F3CDE|nr:hypothetical protein [Mastigocladopsis repens]
MNSKVFAALGVMAALVGLVSKVHAQSSVTPNSNVGADTIQGDSLTGIDNRTAEDDFARFFAEQNLKNNGSRNNFGDSISPSGIWQLSDQVELRRNDPVTTPNDVIFPQGNESFNGNDGVQVQIDLDRNGNRYQQ